MTPPCRGHARQEGHREEREAVCGPLRSITSLLGDLRDLGVGVMPAPASDGHLDQKSLF